MAQKTKKNSAPATPLWEWILAAIGAALVLSAIGTFVYRGLTQDDLPSDFRFTLGTVTTRDGSYAVPFVVKNLGSKTAAALSVEGTLKRGEETVETSVVAITYVPAHSDREGVLVFSKDPAAFKLQVRAVGYEKP